MNYRGMSYSQLQAARKLMDAELRKLGDRYTLLESHETAAKEELGAKILSIDSNIKSIELALKAIAYAH
jgi:hypothetical protein